MACPAFHPLQFLHFGRVRYNHKCRVWGADGPCGSEFPPMTAPTGTRAQEFRDQLSRRVLVADGAMGTMLYARGVFLNRSFDELNLSAPDLVRGIHQDYVKAGSEILETNTFGANRVRLSAFGMAEKLKDINRAGVKLAREAAQAATGATESDEDQER